MAIIKEHKDITHAEWICFQWVDVSEPYGNPQYVRGRPRSFDEAADLAFKFRFLEPYLWPLSEKHNED